MAVVGFGVGVDSDCDWLQDGVYVVSAYRCEQAACLLHYYYSYS